MNCQPWKRPEWVKGSAKAGIPFQIHHQPLGRHNAFNLYNAALLWGKIGVLFSFGMVVHPWVYVPLAGVLMGASFFGHFVLIVHECSHGMFLRGKTPAATQKFNDIVGRMASIPFFTEYRAHWATGHRIHHLKPCEEDDPQDRNPMDGKPLLRALLWVWMVPGMFLAHNPSQKYPGRVKRWLFGLAFWLPVLWLALGMGGHALLMLLVAMNTLVTCRLLKIAQEHGSGLAFETDPLLRSRTYLYPLARIFSPFHINYHFEHHANFNVPWYLIPAYHRAVQPLVPLSLKPYYFHREYMAQMLGHKSLPSRELLQSAV